MFTGYRVQPFAGLDVCHGTRQPGRGRAGIQCAGDRHCRDCVSPGFGRVLRTAECGHVCAAACSVVERSSLAWACLVWADEFAVFDAGVGRVGALSCCFHTSFGLALRAAGENPSAADAAGISVPRMRYIGVLIGGATAGMAGAYLVLAQIGLFRESIVSGQGFIALGIVIFGRWNPWKAALAALVFGACDALQLSLQLGGANIPPQLLASLPYVVTILAISGLFGGRASRTTGRFDGALRQRVRDENRRSLGCSSRHAGAGGMTKRRSGRCQGTGRLQ